MEKKTLYLDCTNGVSGDMVLNSLIELDEDPEDLRRQMEEIERRICGDKDGNNHDHHHHHFHRSYEKVLEIIRSAGLDQEVRERAEKIYAVIAAAESAVHGEALDSLHFHEVGRDQAILNVIGVSLCAVRGGYDPILCSDICDGHGTVECAHGTLTVPVPAVAAMLKNCDLTYRQTETEGEMVTPSGLAVVIGLEAATAERPEGEPIRRAEAVGARSANGRGLVAEIC